MSVSSVLVVVAVILIGGTIAGVSFSDMLDDARAYVTEQQEKKNDSANPDVSKTGNFAVDTGTRICDLEINFVGVIAGHDFYKSAVDGENLTTEDTFLYLGNHGKDIFGIVELVKIPNTNIIDYQWHCKGVPLTNASWLANVGVDNIVKNSVFSKTNGETIRMKFKGVADNGKLLFDDRGLTQFSNVQVLGFNQEYPVALNLQVYLSKVTEDNYKIHFWSDTSQMGVGTGSQPKDKGTVFTYQVLKP